MPDLKVSNNITYLASSFSHHFTNLLTRQLQTNGIAVTAEQFAILVLLWQEGSLPQARIYKTLERDKTTITRVLLNLKKTGFIKQEIDPDDTRMKIVGLTAKGKKSRSVALEIAGALYQNVLKSVKKNELAIAVKVLQQINSNLNAQTNE